MRHKRYDTLLQPFQWESVRSAGEDREGSDVWSHGENKRYGIGFKKIVRGAHHNAILKASPPAKEIKRFRADPCADTYLPAGWEKYGLAFALHLEENRNRARDKGDGHIGHIRHGETQRVCGSERPELFLKNELGGGS